MIINGAKFRHYKGEIITVLGLDELPFPVAKDEVVEWRQEPHAIATDNILDGEPVVFYTADSERVWARPHRVFVEKVEGLGCHRFELLEDG